MSDIHTWNVTVMAPTAGTANFQETTVALGDTIHADFAWTNAVAVAGMYAKMYIFEPDGSTVAESWIEFSTGATSGSHSLNHIVDKVGTWKAEIDVGGLLGWIPAVTDTVLCSSPIIIIDPSSTFNTGPFHPGDTSTVCTVSIKNTGNLADVVHMKLVEYPNTAQEATLVDWSMPNLNPGETSAPYDFDVGVPTGTDVFTWPLGLKAWGDLEGVPSWTFFGVNKGKLELPSWAIPAAAVVGILGFAYIATRKKINR